MHLAVHKHDVLVIILKLIKLNLLINCHITGLGTLYLVLQRKHFAFELFLCLANALDTSKVITNAWFSMKNYNLLRSDLP